MPLAVEMGHLGHVVARAGREFWRYRGIDAREIVGGEFEIERIERLFELIAPARAQHRQDVVTARAHPGKRELRGACTLLAADLAQRFDEPQVLLNIPLLETRHAREAEIALIAGGRQAAAQQSAREH